MVLFIAWGAGSLEPTGLQKFLQDQNSFKALPANNTNRRRAPYTIIYLDNAGGGGESLFVHPASTAKLIKLLGDSANQVNLEIEGEQTETDYLPLRISGAASAYISWNQGLYFPLQDTMTGISPDKLQSLGETLSLALITIVRESSH